MFPEACAPFCGAMGRFLPQVLLLLVLTCVGNRSRLLPTRDGEFCSRSHQGVCGNKCIPLSWICNGEQECPDGLDEQCDVECQGNADAWQCNDGTCIAATWVCDGARDCMDGSDERNCACAKKKVPCRNGKQCIDPWEICDRHKDCDDGSDEDNCLLSNCLAGQWQCKNKACVMENWKCNGVDNCGDHSDEDECVYCPEGMIPCDNGKCVLESLKCNQIKDCLDGTDEPSTCGKNCSMNNGGCTDKCTETYWGVRCSCGPGWSLHPDGQSCTDIDECAMAFSPCSQLCTNTIGSFTCDCIQGYQLSNGTTCEAAGGTINILLAVGHAFALLDIKSHQMKLALSTVTAPSFIAYDSLRRIYYWTDKSGKLYISKTEEMLLYPDVSGVNSLSVDWITGQLYWASSSPPAISAGLSDGRGYVRILEKSVVPEQLTTFPEQRYMYWVNRADKGRAAIEGAGMDGSDRHVLAVVTTEEPVGLTLDHTTGRLYWISTYKGSIETIKVDGTGRYTFPEVLLKNQDLVGLAVVENRFIWADKERLLYAFRTSPGAGVLLNTSVSSFTVLNNWTQLQSNRTACAPGLCSHICLLSPVHVKGYKCACPENTFLMLSGQCAELKILYATSNQIYELDIDPQGSILHQRAVMPEWPENLYFQDVDWNRGFIYWTDDKGELMRFAKETKAKLIIPDRSPACAATVDITTGDLFWLTCDRTEIKVTTFLGMMTQTLYHASTKIWHLFLDWQRRFLYWLESGKPIQRMDLNGRNIKDVWNETWTDVPMVLDASSSSFLWASKDMVLKVLNLITQRMDNIEERWRYGVASAYGPYLVTFNETTLMLWNRRSMRPFAVQAINVQKAIIIFDPNLKSVSGQSVPITKAASVSRTSTASITTTAATAAKITPLKTTTAAKTTTSKMMTAAKITTLKTTTAVPRPATTRPATTAVVRTTEKTSKLKAHETTLVTTNVPVLTTVVCGWTELPCQNNRQCVPYEYFCDGEEDCSDGSDEDMCSIFCSNPGMFTCQNGNMCIRERYYCDGFAQCPDGSDEADCWVPTLECAMRCDNNTRCVPESFLCDGSPDCADHSDERSCVHEECSELQFKCKSGQCVSYALRCDGSHDCKDHSDERDCPVPRLHLCRPGEAQCLESGECILKEWVCDGDADCKDKTDEKDCSLPEQKCRVHQWRCSGTGECIPDLWLCDGKPDCKDGSDEIGCKTRKCQGHEFQCDETCIPYPLVCNGKPDCQDGLDEGRNCAKPCQRSCYQICYRSPSGPKCACNEGFRLRSDRRSCKDIDECKESAKEKCSQTCINTLGSYMCSCHPGYLLEPDGHTCKVVGSEPQLLVAVQYDLILYGLRTMEENVILAATKDQVIFSIDYDLVEQKVFWMDLSAESIKWMNMKNKERGVLVKGIKSDSIAVDWVGRNLYWIDGSSGQLLATQINGTWRGSPEYTIVLENLEQPRSLALNLLDRLMYWSVIGAEPKIEMSSMDGTDREVLINKLGWPTSLTIDLLSWKIFWSDDKFHCIGSAFLDGGGIKVFQLTEIHSPFAVAVFEDYVYWTEMKTKTVQRIDKRNGKNRTVLIKRRGQPYGLKVMHEILRPEAHNPCVESGCSHLCLLNSKKGGRCFCPVDLVLSNDGKTCIPLKESAFVLLAAQATITQIYLKKLSSVARPGDLPDHTTLPLGNISHITAMDYSVRDAALFFSDFQDGFIKVLAIKDAVRVSLKKIMPVEGTVISLALDWLSNNIYWISTKQPSIHVATSDGRYNQVVISNGLSLPTSLVLHPPTAAMCVADLGTEYGVHGPRIECASMDGSSRRILWKRSQRPVGLTIVEAGSRLYWADQAKGTVESIRMDGSQYRLIQTGLRGITLFAAGGGMMFWTTTAHNGVTRVWHSLLGESESWWFREDQKLLDIKIYCKQNQQGRNGCSENNGRCSQICLPTPEGRSCRCSAGYHLQHDTECIKTHRCSEPFQLCKDNSKCIAKEQICNGITDCPDGSDERDCNYAFKKKPQPTSPASPLLRTTSFPGKKKTVAPTMTIASRHTTRTTYVKPEVKKSKSTLPTSTTSVRMLPLDSDQAVTFSVTRKWGRPSLVEEPMKNELQLQPCNRKTCNMRGDCIAVGDTVKCNCMKGYSGDYCQEEERSRAHVAILSIISILLIAMAAGGILIYLRKQPMRQRSSSTESSRTLTTYPKDSEREDNFVEDETCINAAYDPKQELSTPLNTGVGTDL